MRIYILLLACISLLIGSCTKDYLVSESNIRLYVPQLKSGEIQTLTMVFHGEGGEFLRREIVRTSDVQLSSGVVKVHLPIANLSGEEVTITCVSEVDESRISNNADFNSSNIVSVRDDKNNNRFFPALDYRLFRHVMTVFRTGDASMIDTLDITDKYLNKGKVNILFKSIIGNATDARIKFFSLGTSLDFYGKYSAGEFQYKEVLTSFSNDSSSHRTSNLFHASKGEFVANISADSIAVENNTSTPYYLDMSIEFLNSNGDIIGHYRLSDDPSPPSITNPETGEKLPADKLILKSQGELSFEFEGIALVGINLVGWGNVNNGVVTPL